MTLFILLQIIMGFVSWHTFLLVLYVFHFFFYIIFLSVYFFGFFYIFMLTLIFKFSVLLISCFLIPMIFYPRFSIKDYHYLAVLNKYIDLIQSTDNLLKTL